MCNNDVIFYLYSGPWDKNEEWTEKFRNVITERLGMATGGFVTHTHSDLLFKPHLRKNGLNAEPKL